MDRVNTAIKTLTIALGERSYPIHIGADLLDRSDLFEPHLRGDQVLVVSNETVAPIYLHRLLATLAGRSVDSLVLPDGEQYKTLDTLSAVLDRLLERRFARDCTILALGGGVVGDISGFAAACYQRGVGYLQVPTTLLAQVDSSVGGKTGVNHRLGKNMIGAFHQPVCVIADTATLDTLADRELRSGMAEVIKYGLIRDLDLFEWLEQNLDLLMARDTATVREAIERSCVNKAALVAEDEREQGVRALLNLGHTFGHAIETALGYGRWLHGEAIAAGTVMAARLSHRLGKLDGHSVARIGEIFRRAGLPVSPPAEMTPELFRHHMALDKKILKGRLRLILLDDIGAAVICDDTPDSMLDETLSVCCDDGG